MAFGKRKQRGTSSGSTRTGGSTSRGGNATPKTNPYLSGVINPSETGMGALWRWLKGDEPDNPYILGLLNQNKNEGDFKANFGNILARFSGNSDISQLLNALGVNNDKDMSNAAAEDWNKQLLETLLNYYLTQENRSYNESLRDEQRLYDNPQNQLARFMGAGISRDAAIQLLSGAGSGSGAGVPYSDPIASQGLAPSESALNDVNAKSNLANTVFNGVQAFSSLVSLGMSVPQAFSQVQMMSAQAYLTTKQKEAYDAASGAYNVISSAGIDATSDVFGSVANTSKTIEALAKNGNEAAISFMQSGGLNSLRQTAPYSSPFLSQLYRNEVDSQNFSREFENRMRLMDADVDLRQAQKDQIGEQIKLIAPQIEQLESSAEYQRAAANLARANEKLTGQKVNTERQQTRMLELQNILEEGFQSATVGDQSGVDLFSQYRVNELYSKVKVLSNLNDKDAWNKQAESIVKNYDNLIASYKLAKLYADGEINAVTTAGQSTKDLLFFCSAAENCGYFDYVRSLAESETAGSVSSQYYGGSVPVESAKDALDVISNPKKRKK